MDRNLILAIVISILIIIGFQLYFQHVSPPPPKKVPVATEKAPVKERAPAAVPEEKPARPAPTAMVPLEGVAQEKERTITVDTSKYQAVFTSFGARIISFKLKDYMQTLGGKDPVDLFPSGGPDSSGPTIMFTRRDETFNDASLAYSCDTPEQSITISQSGTRQSLVFRAKTAGGLTVVKTFTFHADRYLVDFSVELIDDTSEARNYLVTFPWKKVYFGEDTSGRFQWNSAEVLLNGELKDYYLKDIKGDEVPSGQIEWAGLGDVYFFKALVFGSQPAKKITLFKPTKEGIAEFWVSYGDVDLTPGKPATLDLALYLGPKESHALAAAGHGLSRALVYSYYWVLEMMSVYLMKFLTLCNNGFTVLGIKVPGTHNWGWDIIILTVVIKILFIPLTHKSTQSMKRMQDLQPQIAKLKEKFKDDKAALNKATMELFREHKVNPLGSCWPMFLQLPVFIALYQSLSYAIELRHAGFVCIPSIYLCIADLSAPDPYYVTPILMGGTMVLQQWMTPSAGDPMQRKMMLLMPVVFTWMFLSFPSGLVLYWLVSNILSIAQQAITNRMAK